MSFDYLSDIFGKFRKRKTRFTEVEDRAKALLALFVAGRIGDIDFAREFDKVRLDFMEKLKERPGYEGEDVIDGDTPLWLNSLLGLHFIEWVGYLRVKTYFEKHPEELVGERLRSYQRIQEMDYDRRFRKACGDALEGLK